MTLEAGKCYRTRDGRKTFVASVLPANPFTGQIADQPMLGYIDDRMAFWTLRGNYWACGDESGTNLIGEWQDPVDVPVTVFIDRAGNMLASVSHYTPSRSDVIGYKHATIRVAPGDRG